MNSLFSKKLLLERSLLESLARMLAHDINGKVMGVEGILSCWETLGIEPANVQEDITIVRDSFHDVKTEFQLLNWFFQSDPKFIQAISLPYFNEMAGRFLSRLFHPHSSFALLPPRNERSVSCTPAQLIFWTSSLCYMLSHCRPKDQSVELEVATSAEGTCLEMNCRSEFFSVLRTSKGLPANEPELYDLWLTIFEEAGGQCLLNPKADRPITLTIPLSTP